MPEPDIKQFSITSSDPDIKFIADFGDGSPLVTDGYGGWQIMARPKDVGITEWIGRNPMAIEIPFIIDNWRDNPEDNPGEETEDMVGRLERLCGIGTHNPPPVCVVRGKGVIPHDNDIAKGAHKWVIEDVNWDRALDLRSGVSGRRLRCGGTITIRQYIRSDALDRLNAKSRARSKKKSGKKKHGGAHKSSFYVVGDGDTLSRIAARDDIYGDATQWHKIGDAQDPPIRDSRNIRVGQKLRIP